MRNILYYIYIYIGISFDGWNPFFLAITPGFPLNRSGRVF